MNAKPSLSGVLFRIGALVVILIATSNTTSFSQAGIWKEGMDYRPNYPQADIPAPVQPLGDHSTLTTFDGSIRDDELAEYICSQIPKVNGVPQVHDVKIMFNSCYGGGMLDDIQSVFGPGGPCAGVPWVAGAASAPDQPAYGPSNATVNGNPAANLGSFWTNALVKAIAAGGNVQSSFQTAGNNDKTGPNGSGLENPLVASGNGGSTITWNGASKHRAVVFGGRNNRLRHDNNIENVSDALNTLFGSSLEYIGYGWGDASTGTEAHLKGIISAAASSLDADTQLVLYFDDHGDTDFDLLEYLILSTPYTITTTAPTQLNFPLHGGWVKGLKAMSHQAGDTPAPVLILDTTNWVIPNYWQITINGAPIPLPPSPFHGEVFLPVQWNCIISGTNSLLFTPLSPSAPPISLNSLQLGSGPINEIDLWDVYIPLLIRHSP